MKTLYVPISTQPHPHTHSQRLMHHDSRNTVLIAFQNPLWIRQLIDIRNRYIPKPITKITLGHKMKDIHQNYNTYTCEVTLCFNDPISLLEPVSLTDIMTDNRMFTILDQKHDKYCFTGKLFVPEKPFFD